MRHRRRDAHVPGPRATGATVICGHGLDHERGAGVGVGAAAAPGARLRRRRARPRRAAAVPRPRRRARGRAARGAVPVPGTPGLLLVRSSAKDAGRRFVRDALAELDDLLDEQCAALGFDRARGDRRRASRRAPGSRSGSRLPAQRPAPARRRVLAMSPAIDTAAFDLDEARTRRRCSCSTARTTR